MWLNHRPIRIKSNYGDFRDDLITRKISKTTNFDDYVELG